MSNGAVAAGAAAYAAAVQAIKASGAIVRVDPDEFTRLAGKSERPVVVVSQERIFKTHYKYLMSYGGFVFYAKSPVPLSLPGRAEVVAAGKIWTPS